VHLERTLRFNSFIHRRHRYPQQGGVRQRVRPQISVKHAHTHVHTHAHTHAHTYTHTHARAHTHTCTRAHTYTCTQICMCTYLHVHTHTHTHKHESRHLQPTEKNCNTLSKTPPINHLVMREFVGRPPHCNTLQHTATHCNTLQHTATHCNTLQHTAGHAVHTHITHRSPSNSFHM